MYRPQTGGRSPALCAAEGTVRITALTELANLETPERFDERSETRGGRITAVAVVANVVVRHESWSPVHAHHTGPAAPPK